MPTPPSPGWIDVLFRFVTWLRRGLLRDHSSLYGSWYTRGNFGGYRHIYVTVACGPSRRFRRPRVISPNRTLEFLEQVLPRTFDFPPAQSSRDVVAFELVDSDSTSEPLRAGRVYSNGRIELFVRVETGTAPEEPLIVDLAAAMRPLSAFVAAVRSGGYRKLYGLHSPLHRLDWYVALSNAMSDEHGWRHWDDLRFPGSRPLHRATQAYPAAPQFGLAWQKLRNRCQRTDSNVIVRAVLDDLITESGWDGEKDSAIADTLDAVVG